MRGVRVPWWPLFGIVAVVHVVLLAAGAEPWDSVTKCLAAPLLIGWVLTSGAPRILALALVFCLGGDFLLELDGLFLVGMASNQGGEGLVTVVEIICGLAHPEAALADLRDP